MTLISNYRILNIIPVEIRGRGYFEKTNPFLPTWQDGRGRFSN